MSGAQAAPTVDAAGPAPAAPADAAPPPEAHDDGAAGTAAGQAGLALERFDGGRLGAMLQGGAADQQAAPAAATAASPEQPAAPQLEQPALAAAAQFLPFMQMTQQAVSVPLQQPVSQPATGDDAAEQQRILQQSAQLQQQQVRSQISSRTSLSVARQQWPPDGAQTAGTSPGGMQTV